MNYKDKWETFFERYYKNEILKLASEYPEVTHLDVDYQKIQDFDIALADELLLDSYSILKDAHDALLDYDLPLDERLDITVQIINLAEKIKIRDLRSVDVGNFIAIEGLVRKSTEVRPKLTEAAFECSSCGGITMVEQGNSNKTKKPTECSTRTCGLKGPFKFSQKYSKFVDAQKIQIQENPEGLQGGAQPQTIDADVLAPLVGRLFPGDRAILTGVLRVTPRQYQNSDSNTFDLFLEVNAIEIAEKDFQELEITGEDEEKITELAHSEGIEAIITQSIAPSIFGYDDIKEAISLQLFSGVPKLLPDGSRVRGDIHILLIGDPGIGKSQLLQYVVQLAPRGIYASGKSSTSAGLTAAAVKDDFGDGRWTLEAGALVLADQGIAAVDEMDKLKSEDRSSLHEAMASQTVSVAKAGILATLKCRCALLGAANPRWGRFDPYESMSEQINMQPTLLSRFDLIFVLTDAPNKANDAGIAEHILKSHYAGELASSHKEGAEEAMDVIRPSIDAELLRKFIGYAKRFNPVLTQEAMTRITDYYVGLREQGGEGSPIPITARQLEALIRLAEASARMRLSEEITRDDADRVVRIMESCLSKVGVDPETGVRDFDVISVGKSKTQQERYKNLRDIIKALEKEEGSAHIDKIMEKAVEAGFDKDKTEAEIAKLVQGNIIFEPVRYSHKYRLTQ
jgi:replicative DNA helicase Mcm